MNRRYVLALPLFLALLFLLYYTFISPLFLYHNDIGWHLAAGQWMLSSGKIPATDPWSHTAGDTPWVLLSWGWDISAAWLYTKGGLEALLVLTAIMGAGIVWFQSATALRMGACGLMVIAVSLLGGIAYVQFSPPDVFLSVAPQVVTLFSLALFQFFLVRAQSIQRFATTNMLLMLYIISWSNLHGGFVLGVVLFLFYAIDAWISGRRNVSIRFASMALISVLAIAASNPLHFDAFVMVFGLLTSESQQGISEWMPVWERVRWGSDIPALLYLVLFPVALVGLIRSRQWHPPVLALALLLYVMAWFQIRYISMFVVWSMPLMALGLSAFIRAQDDAFSTYRLRHIRVVFLLLLAAVIVKSLMEYRFPHAANLPDSLWPKEEIAFIENHYRDKNLINHWNYGSFIIYQTRGRVRPYIDGRAGSAYPLSLFEIQARMYHTRDWTEALKTYNIGAVLWPKQDATMLAYFDGRQGWKKAFEGKLAVVYVKTNEQKE